MTYHCCVYSEKTPDDGQRNCPKHVELYSKNKFEKLVHLVGFIIRIYHDARSPERQIIYRSFRGKYKIMNFMDRLDPTFFRIPIANVLSMPHYI